MATNNQNSSNNNNTNNTSLRGNQQLPQRNNTNAASIEDVMRSFSRSAKDLESLLKQWEKVSKQSGYSSAPSSQVDRKATKAVSQALWDLSDRLKDTYKGLGNSGLDKVLDKIGTDLDSRRAKIIRTLEQSEKELSEVTKERISAEEKAQQASEQKAEAERKQAEAEQKELEATRSYHEACRRLRQSQTQANSQAVEEARRAQREAHAATQEARNLTSTAAAAAKDAEDERKAIQKSFDAKTAEYNRVSEQTDQYIERLNTAVENVGKSATSINESIDKLPDIFNTRRNYDNLPGIIKALAPRKEDKEVERREMERLKHEIQEKEAELEKTKQNIEKENENIAAFRQAIADLDAVIDQAEQNGDAEAKQQAQRQRDEAAQNLHQAESNVRDLEIQELQLDTETQVSRRNLETMETFSKTSTKVLTQLGAGASDIITSLVGKFLDQSLEGFNRIYNALEETQNSVARQMKLNSGAYDDFADRLHEIVSDAGYTSITTSDLLEQAATMSDLGITDEGLVEALALSGARLQASGTDLQMDENTVAMFQKQYYDILNSGGTEEEAAAALQKLTDSFIGTQSMLAHSNLGNSAIVNGGANEIVNALGPTMMSMNASVDQIGKAYSDTAVIMQIAQKNGLDSSVLLEDLTTILETKGTGELSTEFLALLQKFGWDADTVRESMMSGDLSQFYSDLLTNMQDLYGGMGSSDTGYTLTAYDSNMTQIQGMGYGNKSGDVLSQYQNFQSSGVNVDTYAADEEAAIREGRYISETQQFDNAMEESNYWLADISQEVAHGNDLVNEGARVLQSSIQSILTFLLGWAGQKFLGKGLGTVPDGVDEALSSAGGGGLAAAGATAKNFMTGAKGTVAGTVGKIAGGIAGGGVMIYSIVDNAKNADSIGEAVEDTFCDPTFYTGLGTTLGSVLGGPLGGAIGGAIGGLASNIGNAIADPVSDWLMDVTGKNDDLEEQARRDAENAEQLQLAADSLLEAGNLHAQNAAEQSKLLQEEQASLETYDTTEQKYWLVKQGHLSAEEANNTSEAEINALFEEHVIKYFEDQQKALEKEALLAQQGSMMDTFGSVIGVDNMGNYTEDEFRDYLQNLSPDEREELTKKFGTTNEDELRKRYNAYMEHDHNVKNMSNSAGFATIDTLSKYQQTMGEGTDLKSAYMEYFSAQLADGTYTVADIDEMVKIHEDLQQYKDAWTANNKDFQSKWSEIQKENPNAIPYELIQAYDEKFAPTGGSVAEAIQGLTSDGNVRMSWQTSEDGLPMLKYTDSAGDDTYHPNLYLNKFATGLSYVPEDNYLALLHEGEMVLNKQTAEHYRKDNILDTDYIDNALSNVVDNIVNNQSVVYGDVSNTTSTGTGAHISFNTAPITTAIDSQSARIEQLLQKILQAITTSRSSRFNTTGSSVSRLDSNVSRMAQ